MAGLYFGKSSWDNIPQTLGLTVAGGVLTGAWQGVPVEAYFFTRHENEQYYHYTHVRAHLDPPLGLEGLESGEAFNRVLDEQLRTEIEVPALGLGLQDIYFRDDAISAEWYGYESDPARYRATFDLFA